jgi:coproporphyrinogen III oxidase
MIQHMRARKANVIDEKKEFDMFVAGMSTVCHPHNPMAPTFHASTLN